MLNETGSRSGCHPKPKPPKEKIELHVKKQSQGGKKMRGEKMVDRIKCPSSAIIIGRTKASKDQKTRKEQ